MKHFFKKRWIYLILALLILWTCLLTYKYQGEAISGTVIDADSKAPLQGVVVVALWELRGGIFEARTVGYAQIDEVVTDAEGRYQIPAWGPLRTSVGYMSSSSPVLLFFKQDYQYERTTNGVSKRTPYRTVWASKWDGKTIEMQRFEGNIFEYKRHLEFLNGAISSLRDGENCEWKEIPYFLVEIHMAEIGIKKQSVMLGSGSSETPKPPGINMKYYYTVNEVWNQKKCGSAKEFFKDYLGE